ncbi:MAG: RNA polymerase sigma factor [Candidatus Marithrix sp.]|nr:RNA polymerase sigma factor [Candidatus Marithrix sp.]
MAMTDKQAVADMRRGGKKGLAMLHQHYEGRVKTFLRSRYDINKSDAEEICNDVFFKFYKTIDTYKEKAAVFTWLIILARHKASDYFKKRGGTLPQVTDDDIENIIFDQNTEKDLCYEWCVRKIIAKLKNSSYANCITALILLVKKVSIKDIAFKINRTPNATAVFMTACRKKLRGNTAIKNCWKNC